MGDALHENLHVVRDPAGTSGAAAAAADPDPLPRAMPLEGLHAYAEKILSAGDTIHFRVSSTVPYELSVCRLGHSVDDPAGDEVLHTFPESPPESQPIHPGSFLHVARGLPAGQSFAALTLECWVRPWRLNGWQSIMGQHNYPADCGYGLGLDHEGRLQFYLGDGGKYRPERVGRIDSRASSVAPCRGHLGRHHEVTLARR